MKKKRKRKRPPMPSLTLLDRALYTLGYLFCFALIFAAIFLTAYLRERVALSVPDTVARTGSAPLWFAVPFWVFLISSSFFAVESQRDKKRPLFGRKGFRYGPPRWAEIYPLFSRDFRKRSREEMRPDRVRSRRIGRRVWLITLILLLCLSPLSLFGRKTVDSTYHFYRYNLFNIPVECYRPEEIASARIYGTRHSNKSSFRSTYSYHIDLTMEDGTTFSFSPGSFTDTDSHLTTMLRLKALVPPESITYGSPDWALKASDGMSAEELKQLYALFNIER